MLRMHYNFAQSTLFHRFLSKPSQTRKEEIWYPLGRYVYDTPNGLILIHIYFLHSMTFSLGHFFLCCIYLHIFYDREVNMIFDPLLVRSFEQFYFVEWRVIQILNKINIGHLKKNASLSQYSTNFYFKFPFSIKNGQKLLAIT